jgi:hypothetical protein
MTSEPTFFRIRKVLEIENRPFSIQATLIIDVNNTVHDYYVVVEEKNICRFLRQKKDRFLFYAINCKVNLVPLIAKPTLTLNH